MNKTADPTLFPQVNLILLFQILFSWMIQHYNLFKNQQSQNSNTRICEHYPSFSNRVGKKWQTVKNIHYIYMILRLNRISVKTQTLLQNLVDLFSSFQTLEAWEHFQLSLACKIKKKEKTKGVHYSDQRRQTLNTHSVWPLNMKT